MYVWPLLRVVSEIRDNFGLGCTDFRRKENRDGHILTFHNPETKEDMDVWLSGEMVANCEVDDLVRFAINVMMPEE